MPKIEKIVTDEELKQAFLNTNFGTRTEREVIKDTLIKIKQGYHSGRTSTVICIELGLMTNKVPRVYKLTAKGKDYLLETLTQRENNP